MKQPIKLNKMSEVLTDFELKINSKRPATPQESDAIAKAIAILDKAGLEFIGSRPKRT